MRNFSFANLLGGKKTRAENEDAQDDDDTTTAAEDGDEEDQAAEDGSEDDSEDDDTDAAAEEDEDDGEGDEASSFTRGRHAERRRIGAILSSDAVTAGNLPQALHMACNTDLKPAAAVEILKAGPAGGATRLAAAMSGRGPKPISSPGAGGDGDDNAAARILAVAGNAKRRKET